MNIPKKLLYAVLVTLIPLICSALANANQGQNSLYINNSGEVVVYESANLTVTSPLKWKGKTVKFKNSNNLEEWCQRKTFNLHATYDVNHVGRGEIFQPYYEEYFENEIYPRLDKTCKLSKRKGISDTFILYMFKKGDVGYWDYLQLRARHKFNPTNGIRESELQFLEMEKYRLGEAKKKLAQEEYTALSEEMRRNRRINAPETEIFSNDLIQIYPPNYREEISVGDKFWCKNPQLNVVAKIPLKKLHTYITDEYLSQIAPEILTQQCTSPSSLQLYFYQENSHHYWEQAYYSVKKRANLEGEKIEYALANQWISDGPLKQMTQIAEYRKNPYIMWQCEEGMFCDLPGGAYLNAIYHNDSKAIQKLEERSYREMKSAARQFDINSGLELIGIRFADHIEKTSLLQLVANMYMYQYQYNYSSCLTANAQSRTFSYTTPKFDYTNLYGMDMGSVGGDRINATYTVNPEFISLLERLGSHFGSQLQEMGANFHKIRGMEITLSDTKRLQQNYKCDGPEVKQFETNLIDLTKKSLGTKPY